MPALVPSALVPVRAALGPASSALAGALSGAGYPTDDLGIEQPPPDVSDAVRRETAAQLTAQRDRQLAKLKEHERLAVRAERLQCARLVGKVVDDIGFDAAALIADCATDVRNRGQLQSCVVRAGKELAHYGVISERERGWLARCATVIDIEELKRLAEGEAAVAPRRR